MRTNMVLTKNNEADSIIPCLQNDPSSYILFLGCSVVDLWVVDIDIEKDHHEVP